MSQSLICIVVVSNMTTCMLGAAGLHYLSVRWFSLCVCVLHLVYTFLRAFPGLFQGSENQNMWKRSQQKADYWASERLRNAPLGRSLPTSRSLSSGLARLLSLGPVGFMANWEWVLFMVLELEYDCQRSRNCRVSTDLLSPSLIRPKLSSIIQKVPLVLQFTHISLFFLFIFLALYDISLENNRRLCCNWMLCWLKTSHNAPREWEQQHNKRKQQL